MTVGTLDAITRYLWSLVNLGRPGRDPEYLNIGGGMVILKSRSCALGIAPEVSQES